MIVLLESVSSPNLIMGVRVCLHFTSYPRVLNSQNTNTNDKLHVFEYRQYARIYERLNEACKIT